MKIMYKKSNRATMQFVRQSLHSLEIMRTICLIILLLPITANADNFYHRVKLGEKTLATTEGMKYEPSMALAANDAVSDCAPTGKFTPLTFAANVNDDGTISSVEVQPVTKFTRCFKKHFARSRLPEPPSSPRINGAYPIGDEISMANEGDGGN